MLCPTVGDVAPGECVFVDVKGELHTHQCVVPDGAVHSPCLFEYVYFARPDSVLDKVPVYEGASIGHVLPTYTSPILVGER